MLLFHKQYLNAQRCLGLMFNNCLVDPLVGSVIKQWPAAALKGTTQASGGRAYLTRGVSTNAGRKRLKRPWYRHATPYQYLPECLSNLSICLLCALKHLLYCMPLREKKVNGFKRYLILCCFYQYKLPW